MTQADTVSRDGFAILITDDDAGSREALRDAIEPEGFRTHLAASGEEAYDIVSSKRIDLALLDMHMPSMTGLEALQLMRQINDRLPAILVTAGQTPRLLRQAFAADVFTVIPKPVQRKVLLHTVIRALDKFYNVIDETRTDNPH